MDGLVEMFNQTPRAMFRTATDDGKECDKLIPYVLFAYCEVPQASTGLSPFDVQYGGTGCAERDMQVKFTQQQHHVLCTVGASEAGCDA